MSLDLQHLFEMEIGLRSNDAQQFVRWRPRQRERVQLLPQADPFLGTAERRCLEGDLVLTLGHALLLLVFKLGATICQRAWISDCIVIEPSFDHRLLLFYRGTATRRSQSRTHQ
jgi:hypothetical protein